jgi:hypothetical protein
MASTYQTYLFDCECVKAHLGLSGMIPRILFWNLIPCCAWCRTPLVKAALTDYEEGNFLEEKKEMDKEMDKETDKETARDFEVELPSHLRDEKWQMKIIRAQNGYTIEFLDDSPYAIQENENDRLKEHEELLWYIMDYFNFQGSKHDLERLRIVREKQK